MSTSQTSNIGATRLRVWDLPTRAFHWLLALCTFALIITAKIGGNAMEWHLRLGHVMIALLLFRILWGFTGGYWSRFSTFVPSPKRLLRYLKGQSPPADHIGHNPLGALSVLAMLVVLSAQVITGLLSDDEIAFAGSLVRFVSGSTITDATAWHTGWGQWLVYALIALHLLAIAFYGIVRRRPLVAAMLHGDTPSAPAGLPASRDGLLSLLPALCFAAACVVMAYWVWTLAFF